MSELPIFSLDAANYTQHTFHRCERDWLESNCYIDVYIELLSALQVDVHACLAFTLSSSFEGDQWTFFKPPLNDMKALYGIEINELTLWKPLWQHVAEQVGRGRIVCPEVDSFYLPDTAATDYKTAHVKTTVGIPRIDVDNKVLGYFHNASYHELSGDDFDGVFRLGMDSPDDYLPPYCEFVKVDHLVQRPRAELRELALDMAKKQLSFLPDNPMRAYAERLPADLDWLITQDQATYHNYVFAGLRQCGANFEFASFFADWLQQDSDLNLQASVDGFRQVSQIGKMLILKLARITRSKKIKDITPQVLEMAEAWDRATDHFGTAVGA